MTLLMMDLDGTLIRSFLEEGKTVAKYEDVEVLPNRVETIRELAAHTSHRFALVTNQGGVAWGFQTVEQVRTKLGKVCAELGFFFDRPFSVHVCLTHPEASVAEYRKETNMRKPGPGMLWKAMGNHGVTAAYALYVGDMATDQQAAEAAGVEYQDAAEFFKA